MTDNISTAHVRANLSHLDMERTGAGNKLCASHSVSRLQLNKWDTNRTGL